MSKLIEIIQDVSNVQIHNNMLFVTSQKMMRIISLDTIKEVSRFDFQLYPRILTINNNTLLIIEGSSFYSIDTYRMIKEKTFDLELDNIWNIHHIVANKVLLKQSNGDQNNQFKLLRYDLETKEIIWKADCDRYGFYVNDKTHHIIFGKNTKSIHVYHINTGEVIWTFNLSSVLYELEDSTRLKITSYPFLKGDLLILRINAKNEVYHIGLSISNKRVLWKIKGHANTALFQKNLFSISFHGDYFLIDAFSGKIIESVNLKSDFKKWDVNCENQFLVTDKYIYFKYGVKGKVGILNRETLSIQNVIQLPDNNTISSGEVPIIENNRLYIRSSPQNNLFIYEN